KASPRRKFSDFQVCRSGRTPRSTNADAKAAPSQKVRPKFSADALPAFVLHRLLWRRHLDVPSGSTSAGSLDTARNLSSTTSLSRRLLQSAANTPSIRDQR